MPISYDRAVIVLISSLIKEPRIFKVIYFLLILLLVSCKQNPLSIAKGKVSFSPEQNALKAKLLKSPLVADNITPPDLTEELESLITLTYSNPTSEEVNTCIVSALNSVVESTPCSCTLGVCTVGITGIVDHYGGASFKYVLTTSSYISNVATATLNILNIDDDPIANNIFPDNGRENQEHIITLSYTDPDGDLATGCSLSNLSNVSETTLCSCSGAGVCTVGVTGGGGYLGPASFDYTVVANGQTSNVASSEFNITSNTPFVSEWRTTSANETITLPLKDGYLYNAVVDWGDGSGTFAITSYDDPDASHTYSMAGDYTVTISGMMEAWNFLDGHQAGSNRLKIIEVSEFGGLGWENLEFAFYNCTNLVSFEGGETASVINMNSMFKGASSLNFLDISSFDTSRVQDMGSMFYQNSGLVSLDLSALDTSSVENMESMFSGASSLIVLNISNFNTANVTDMSYMFADTSSLASLNVSSFNTANVIDMSYMFYNMSNVTNLNLSNFTTSNVENMNFMFGKVFNLSTLDISNFNTLNVENMGSMFYQASSLTTLDLSHFNTINVNNMSSMFLGASSLTSLDISSFNTANVTDMGAMFHQLSSVTSLDLSHFDTFQVTNMSSMFSQTFDLTALDATGWDIANVTNSTDIWNSTNAALVVTCDQGGAPGTGNLFGETCN